MSDHPFFCHRDIVCPRCDETETVRLATKINDDQSESLIWCARGHIGFLDRHDRYHYLMCNHEPQYIWKMVDLTKADREAFKRPKKRP